MKKDEYLVVTNCGCCGKLTSVVIPSNVGEKHEHLDIPGADLDLIMAVPVLDLCSAEKFMAEIFPYCSSKLGIRRAKNVYNICRRTQPQA